MCETRLKIAVNMADRKSLVKNACTYKTIIFEVSFVLNGPQENIIELLV